MSFRCHVYASEAAARRAIAAINAARPTTEIMRNETTRQERTVAAKPWAIDPIPLADGTFAVPWDARLLPVEGRVVRVDGSDVTIPLDAAAVAKQRTDVARAATPDAAIAGRA